MYFAVLGALQIRADDGTSLAVAAPKRRTILELLLLQAGRPITVEQLSAAMWGERPPRAARESLHAHISRLRREIGADRIETSVDGYILRLAEDELDVRVFERYVADGRRLIETQQWDAAAVALRTALSLWRGPAYPATADSPMAQIEVARLEDLQLGAFEDRVTADLARGGHRAVCGELEVMIARHPLRENLWRMLMLALYRSGRQADALGAYRRLRTTLVEDLGVDPAPDLQEMEIRILRQDSSLDGPPTGSFQPPVRLPRPRTSFVGRQADLVRAVALVGSHRLLTLTGPGGVGKTRLAIEIAHAVLEDHPDGVLFVDVSAVRDPSLVLERIGDVTGGGGRPADVIGRRRMLLVLDNLEQVIDAAIDVSALLDDCPSLRIIVTSRAPLRIRGEQRLEVRPLANEDAAGLFAQRARDALRSDVRTRAIIDDIVDRLDGLPLAIELAAARLSVLTQDSLRDRLVDRLTILTTGTRDSPDRHRTLRDTIAWSYGLLDPASQAAFERLSVLAGGFDLSAALAVAACDIDRFGSLVENSLVYRDGDRYAMLETIREFAAQSLGEGPALAAARDRHLEHFVSRAWTARFSAADGRPTRSREWLAMCHAELENLRVAFDWADRRGDGEAVVSLYRSVAVFWLLIGATDEGERWGEVALRSGPAKDPSTRLTILSAASEFPRFSGDPGRSAALKLEAVDIARSVADNDVASIVLDDLASVYASTGEYAKARDCLAESLAARANLPDQPLDRVHPLSSLIELELRESHTIEAAAHLAELDAAEAGRDLIPDWAVELELLRARVKRATGDDVGAAAHLQTVIRDAGRIGFRMPLAEAIDELAAMSVPEDPPRAARLLGMSDRLRAEGRLVGWDPGGRARTVATTRASLGDIEFARVHAEGHALTMAAIVESCSATAADMTASMP